MSTAAPPPDKASPAVTGGAAEPARPLLVFGTITAALAIVAVIVALLAGAGRDGFTKGTKSTVSELQAALRAKGLAICSAGAPDSGHGRGGSRSTQVLRVSRPGGCASAIDVQIDAYQDAAHRDAAARNAEMQERERNYGVVYTWRQFTVYLQADDASTGTGVRDRVVAALAAVGAN